MTATNDHKKKMSPAKRILLAVLCFILALLLIVGGYVSYVFIAYHRLGSMILEVQGQADKAEIETETEYKIISYNIGFGAYESDYGFFMDGGKESRAWSEERLDANLKNIAELLKKQNADLCFVQEVDIGSTRSYGFDERSYLTEVMAHKNYTFAQNYDSPYLFYPLFDPHGASKSGIMVFSDFTIKSSERVELPIERGVAKLLDLDRCYSKNEIKTANGKSLFLYNFHLSAYTSDGKIANEQLKLVLSDMEEEYKKDNYCIAGGDFNKDILGDSSVYFGKSDIEYTWAQPIPEEVFEGYSSILIAPLDSEAPVPTCRNADGPYHEGQYVLTIDGFLITPNVESVSASIIDSQFAYSDHNPVEMTFVLH